MSTTPEPPTRSDFIREIVAADRAAGKNAGRVVTRFPPEPNGYLQIRFACGLDPDLASFHALTPFPGSELWERRHELCTVAEDFGSFTYQGAAFVPHTMTREEIQRQRELAYRRFYPSPRYLAPRTLGIRSLHEVRAAWRGARSLVALWTGRRIFRRDDAGRWRR